MTQNELEVSQINFCRYILNLLMFWSPEHQLCQDRLKQIVLNYLKDITKVSRLSLKNEHSVHIISIKPEQ